MASEQHELADSLAAPVDWRPAAVTGIVRGCALAAVLVAGLAGFLVGPAALAGVTGFWIETLLPIYLKVYVYGVALCT